MTLPPALRSRFGFGTDANALLILEERDGEFWLRPAAAVALRDIPSELVTTWLEEDEAGMREFQAMNEFPK